MKFLIAIVAVFVSVVLAANAMVLPEQKDVFIYINYVTLHGTSTFDITVPDDIQIKDLRVKIAEHVKSEPKTIVLIYRTRLLTDEHKLSDYRIAFPGPIYTFSLNA